MQYTTLGRTGLKVSRICLGTMNFGSVVDEAESFAILDRALELGVNFLDTADFYGRPPGQGLTESIVGRWLEKSGQRRQVVLATKLYATMGPGVNDRGLSAYHMRDACQDSLRRLRTDHIDLYQAHHVDRGVRARGELANIGRTGEFDLLPGVSGGFATPWEEIWQGFGQLIQRGDVLYAGGCNMPAWEIARADAKAEKRNLLGLVSEQSLYNLTQRTIELEVVPACRALGLGILPYSPLAGGLLGGGALRSDHGRRSDALRDRYRDPLARYEDFCRERGSDPADVALAWLLHQPAVTAPIVGPRTVAQLESSVKATTIRLTADDLSALDRIWPGPGGEAPEAYAW